MNFCGLCGPGSPAWGICCSFPVPSRFGCISASESAAAIFVWAAAQDFFWEAGVHPQASGP
jgi:hypothetical protein